MPARVNRFPVTVAFHSFAGQAHHYVRPAWRTDASRSGRRAGAPTPARARAGREVFVAVGAGATPSSLPAEAAP